ncbi:MAG: DUF1549 and DUF1553 domain-containing protein [Planctomycetota bacterium]|nr:DUF1549 and DUF1553 domain-containing protein [Planctomycetota bacterium]MDA1211740.1 DUF1549 and DUF1553 domain-containing protein [Planctomycetota bacterium]
MTEFNENNQELDVLLEAMCENNLTSAQVARLEQLVLGEPAMMRRYLEYIDLHGSLLWDVGVVASQYTDSFMESISDEYESMSSEETKKVCSATVSASATPHAANRRSRHRLVINAGIAAVCMIGGAFLLFNRNTDRESALEMANRTAIPSQGNGASSELNGGLPVRGNTSRKLQRIELDHPKVDSASTSDLAVNSSGDSDDNVASSIDGSSFDGSALASRFGASDQMVAFIDDQIASGLEGSGVRPSEIADDSEWLRRVYLDIVGHIPSSGLVLEFLNDPRLQREKREAVVERLLDDPAFVRNWTTIWTNLLIGRSLSPDVDRPALQKFLRDSFAHNRPWNEVVYDIVAAEGSTRENGAAAFLVAHMNNQAVPATAITARIFLGTQVQCTQCHDHPFNDWKQDQFWELKSFFKQTTVVRKELVNPQTGETERIARLQVNPVGDPEFYENRRGLMKVAYPVFDGVNVDRSEAVNRRQELAKLMTDGSRPQLAMSLVNRMWQHFFGKGFTSPVDDMGPHNTPTHPELLERLSQEFVNSGYDMKKLIRWICLSEAYQRSSQFNDTNLSDNPEAGLPPMFSRVYPKSMTAEQLYDSLVVATRPQNQKRISWAADEPLRDQWMQQFVTNMNTDENNEMSNFEGTVSLALLMMNSEMISKSLSLDRGSYLSELLKKRMTEQERLRLLCVSALSREPTQKEMELWRKIIVDRVADSQVGDDRQLAMAQGLQDVFWAYLNSNEFVIIP